MLWPEPPEKPVPPDKAAFLVCNLSPFGNRMVGQGKGSTEAQTPLPSFLPFAPASNGPESLVKEGRRKPASSPEPPRSALMPGFSSRSEKQFGMCELFRADEME